MEHQSLAGRQLTDIPFLPHAQHVQHLDLSYNNIHNLSNLTAFTALQKLVLDHNNLEEKTLESFPKINTLNTLWINNNNFIDLPLVLELLSDKCPNLQIFSMMRNPACPDPFLSQSEVSEMLYQRYRFAVIHAFPKLQFLDASPVTVQEKKAAAQQKQELTSSSPLSHRGYQIAARPVEQDSFSPNSLSPPPVAKDPKIGMGLDMQPDNRKRRTGAFINKARVRYDGTNSEGNRFIKNRDL